MIDCTEKILRNILFLVLICGIDGIWANLPPSNIVTDEEYQLYPLGIACRDGDLETVKQLLSEDKEREPMAMANICYEYDILYAAIYYNQEAILRYALTKYKDINNRIYSDEYGLTLLVLACKKSNVNLSKILLEHGINVNGYQNQYDLYTVYPLMVAIEQKNIELVRLLLVYQADLNIKDEEGQTPLSLAEKLNAIHIVDLLRKHLELQEK